MVAEFRFRRESDFIVPAAAYCDSLVCIPSFDIRLTKKTGDPLESSYITSSLQTNTPIPSVGNFTELNLVYIPITLFYSSEGLASTPPTVRNSFFEEVDRYSVGDTVIDSFAISAIIVSSILLFVTLAKLLLFLVFNSRIYHL